MEGGLIERTNAYKIVANDKKAGRLFHAYLLLDKDEKYLRSTLKRFAKLILCEKGGCGECRVCRLIEKESYADAVFFPKIGDKILTEDVNAIIEDSFVKPLEGDKKLFAVSGAQNMPAAAQNKLLKTLEEPPQNVILLLGASNPYALLPTVRSRVKTLEIPPFTDGEIVRALEKTCPDKEKLALAAACGDGTLGRAEELYGDEELEKLFDLTTDIVVNMRSSRDVLKYSSLLMKNKERMGDVFSIASSLFRDMLAEKEGGRAIDPRAQERVRGAEGYTAGALVHALEKTEEAQKRAAAFNANETMLAEWWLFAILEGKHIWQK